MKPAGWKALRSDSRFAAEFGLTAAALVASLMLLTRFLQFVEARPGVRLDDPLLAALPSHDVTWGIFGAIYGGILLALIRLLPDPAALLHVIKAYALLLLFRIAAMWAVPLDPPEGMIVLVDPVAGLGPGGALTRDLFFSGHTAMLFLLTLAVPGRGMKITFLLMTAATGFMVLLQHCHYTIDVLAAPFFTYAAYRITGKKSV